MSRSSLGLCGFLFLSLATYGCGSDESSSSDAAVSVGNDGGDQSETGTGIGRGRPGGGFEETDAASADAPKAQLDAAVADASVPKLDGGLAADSGTACESKCAPIRTRYLAAVTAAKSCRTTSRGQCEVSVAPDLFCAGCNVWVNTSTAVTAIAKEWSDAGCGTCNLGKCIQPLRVCIATDGVCNPKLTTTFATVPVAGTIPVVDPGIVIIANDGMCGAKELSVQPF